MSILLLHLGISFVGYIASLIISHFWTLSRIIEFSESFCENLNEAKTKLFVMLFKLAQLVKFDLALI